MLYRTRRVADYISKIYSLKFNIIKCLCVDILRIILSLLVEIRNFFYVNINLYICVNALFKYFIRLNITFCILDS